MNKISYCGAFTKYIIQKLKRDDKNGGNGNYAPI